MFKLKITLVKLAQVLVPGKGVRIQLSSVRNRMVMDEVMATSNWALT